MTDYLYNITNKDNDEVDDILDYLTLEEKKELSCCELCPRRCKVNRLEGQMGFCKSGVSYSIALIINHKGEEPVLSKDKGICNIFFSHCNCQCVFCQNYKISNNITKPKNLYHTMDDIIEKISEVLKISSNVVGFVSATHQIPIMKAIIRQLHAKGLFPKIVYNTGGYDSVEQLKKMADIIDVYLPDYKYADDTLAEKFSHCKDYSSIAMDAIKEMYYQKGSSIITDEQDDIVSGLIIRHLLLPSHLQNSKKALQDIAWQISNNICLSLMSQYSPPFDLNYKELNNKVNAQEYNLLKDYAYSLGFHKGYFQDLDSVDNVLPDFDNNNFINNH